MKTADIKDKSENTSLTSYRWRRKVPFLKNRFLIREILFSVMTPAIIFLGFTAYVVINKRFSQDVEYIIAMAGIFFGLLSLLLLVAYKGKYASNYVVDDQGIVVYMVESKKKPNLISGIFGVLSGFSQEEYFVEGKDYFIRTRQKERLRWEEIKKIKYYPMYKAIYIKNGLNKKTALFCTPDNYDEISGIVYKNVKIKIYSKEGGEN